MANVGSTFAPQNPEDQAVMSRILRRRRMADMLASKEPLPAGQMVGNRFVPTPWTMGLANALGDVTASYQNRRADDDELQLARTRNERFTKALMAQLGGTQTQAQGPQSQDVSMAPYDLNAPTQDQRLFPKAYESKLGPMASLDDLQARHTPAVTAPSVKVEGSMGGSQSATPSPDAAFLATILQAHQMGASPDMLTGELIKYRLKQSEPFNLREGERRMMGDNVIAENPKPAPVHVVTDPITGKVYNATAQGTSEIGSMTPKPSDNLVIAGPDGMPIVNKPVVDARKDIAAAGAAKTAVEVNSQLPASQQAQKEFMSKMSDRRDKLVNATPILDNIEKAKALVAKSGSFVGSGAESKLAIVKFFNNNLGFNIDPASVRSAEELRSRLFIPIMESLRSMDAQPSQMQQQMMQEALGRLGTDPGALPAVLNVFADVLRGKVKQYNQDAKSAEGRGVKFPYDPYLSLPPSIEELEAEVKRRGLKK